MPHPAFQRHPVGCWCCFEFHCVLHARCQRGPRESCCHVGSGAQWQVSRRKRWKLFALLVGGILPFSTPKDPQRLFMNSHLFLLSFIICICSSISNLYLYLNLHQYQYLSDLDMLIHFLNLHLYIYIYILSIFIKFPNGSHGYRPGLLWHLAAFMAGLSLAAYRGVRQPSPDLEPTGSLGHGGSYWEWVLEMV